MKHLASGGMAELLLARARGLEGFERHFVIKRIGADRERDQGFIEMFLAEARLSAVLHHSNIVQVHDIGEDDGKPYFAMEYVHGEDLRRILTRLFERKQVMPLDYVISIITQTAAALHHAHEALGPDRKPLGIVHRDVAPANIIVGYDGSVKVVDFGIARAALRRTETQTGALAGKAPYMAPEQCRGGTIDRRSDVFSLGTVLHELLTTRRLFKGDSEFMTMSAVVDANVPPPSQFRGDVPPALDAVVLKALSRDPAQRFQSAEEMHMALSEIAVQQGLRSSGLSLAGYMKELFGHRMEPWLADDDRPVILSCDFDGTLPGVAPPPTGAIDAPLPAQAANSRASPMAVARTNVMHSTASIAVARLENAMKAPRPDSTGAVRAAVRIPDAGPSKPRAPTQQFAIMAPPPRSDRPKTVQIPASQMAAVRALIDDDAKLPVDPPTSVEGPRARELEDAATNVVVAPDMLATPVQGAPVVSRTPTPRPPPPVVSRTATKPAASQPLRAPAMRAPSMVDDVDGGWGSPSAPAASALTASPKHAPLKSVARVEPKPPMMPPPPSSSLDAPTERSPARKTPPAGAPLAAHAGAGAAALGRITPVPRITPPPMTALKKPTSGIGPIPSLVKAEPVLEVKPRASDPRLDEKLRAKSNTDTVVQDPPPAVKASAVQRDASEDLDDVTDTLAEDRIIDPPAPKKSLANAAAPSDDAPLHPRVGEIGKPARSRWNNPEMFEPDEPSVVVRSKSMLMAAISDEELTRKRDENSPFGERTHASTDNPTFAERTAIEDHGTLPPSAQSISIDVAVPAFNSATFGADPLVSESVPHMQSAPQYGGGYPLALPQGGAPDAGSSLPGMPPMPAQSPVQEQPSTQGHDARSVPGPFRTTPASSFGATPTPPPSFGSTQTPPPPFGPFAQQNAAPYIPPNDSGMAMQGPAPRVEGTGAFGVDPYLPPERSSSEAIPPLPPPPLGPEGWTPARDHRDATPVPAPPMPFGMSQAPMWESPLGAAPMSTRTKKMIAGGVGAFVLIIIIAAIAGGPEKPKTVATKQTASEKTPGSPRGTSDTTPSGTAVTSGTAATSSTGTSGTSSTTGTSDTSSTTTKTADTTNTTGSTSTSTKMIPTKTKTTKAVPKKIALATPSKTKTPTKTTSKAIPKTTAKTTTPAKTTTARTTAKTTSKVTTSTARTSTPTKTSAKTTTPAKTTSKTPAKVTTSTAKTSTPTKTTKTPTKSPAKASGWDPNSMLPKKK